MNGRVYDPSIGRFLSADKQVPYITHTQSFNRYSYVQNNPLSRVDPSGYGDMGYDENAKKKKTQPPPCPGNAPRGSDGKCPPPPECDEKCQEEEKERLKSEKQKAKAKLRRAQRFCSRDSSSKACQNNSQGYVDAVTKLSRDKLIKAHKELRAMVLGTAISNPDAYIYLSKENQQILLAYTLMKTQEKEVSLTSYISNFIGADTFIYKDALTSRNFLLEGFGMVKGGNLNYIAVGMMAAHYDHSLAMVPIQSVIWNGMQFAFGEGRHNYNQMYSGSFWGGYGHEYYKQNKE